MGLIDFLVQSSPKKKEISLEEMKKKEISNIEKLKAQDIHPMYQYSRFDDGSVLTTCSLENKKRDVVAVGYAIGSHRDNFCRIKGRYHSICRATPAFTAKRNLFPVRLNPNNNEASYKFRSDFWGKYMVKEVAKPKKKSVK
jgi:hypothetical protein